MTTTNNQRRKRTHGHIRLFGALLLIIIFSFIAIHIFSALGPTPPPNSKSDHGYFSFIFKGITGAVSGELSIPIDSESQVNLTLENTSVENATLENNTINDVNLDNATSSNTTLENITLPILNDSSISNNSDLLNTTLPNENNSLENISNDNNSNNAVVEEPAPFVSSPQEPTVNVSNNNINLPVVDLVIDFKDKSNKKIGKTKIIDDNGKYKLEISSDNKPVKSKGVLGLSSDNSNKKDKKLNVTVYGLQNINDNIKVKADVYSGKNPSHIGFNTEVFGMDPVEMDNATIILEKTGEVDAIFHCANFEIDNFDFLDWKTTNIPFIDHGDSIEFTVTHFSAYGGGEINATNADHLDENLTFVSSIFTEIEALDEVWSEAIYQNETVRVTYQNNLTNGSVIDFFARSNNTYALFEVYEFNTTTKVGQSQPIVNEEMSHLTINNLTRNNNIFDFKIIKILITYK